MNKQLKERLKSWIGKRIEVDFTKGGLIGNCETGKLVKIYGDYVEIQYFDDDKDDITVINVKEANSIKLEK